MKVIIKLLLVNMIMINNSSFSSSIQLISFKIKNDYEIDRIPTNLTTRHNEQLFSINQGIDFSWIWPLFYNTKLKDSRIITTINEGTIVQDIIMFNQGKVILDKFQLVQSSDSLQISTDYRIAGFGLCFKYSNTNLSLTHHLKESSYINSLSYSLIFNSTDNDYNNSIVFGGIPASSISHSKKIGRCQVNTIQSKWSCYLKKITIGELTYINKNEMHFEAGIRYIEAPKDFFDFMIDFVFKNELELNNCALYDRLMIYCKCSIRDYFPSINFTIGDYEYHFKASELFQDTQRYCNFLIYQNNHDNNTWRLGRSFMKYFDILFDYNTASIELYSSDDNRLQIIPNKINYFLYLYQWLYNILLLILIIGIIIVLYIQASTNNNK